MLHIAQFNVARMKAPLDHPAMASFVAQLSAVNAMADASPGFVWRLETAAGDATTIRIPGDETLLVNLSVWETIESLRGYTYEAAHRAALGRRREWFESLGEEHLVLWWVAPGHRPTVREARARLEMLRRFGPSPEAFTFRCDYPSPADPAPPE